MAKTYALLVCTGGSLECRFFVACETRDQQWERLLAKGLGKGTQQKCWSHNAHTQLPCELEHWEWTRWQGTGEKRRKVERDKEKEETERGCGATELGHAVSVRGEAVWWTAVRGCAHSAERLPEGSQNGAHHYAAKGSAGLALSPSLSLSLLHSYSPMHHCHSTSVIQWNRG